MLITDLGMSGMSDNMLIGEVRSLRPRLPVILVSGYGGRRRAGAFQQLADEVLTKPLRTDALATSLARVLC